MITLKSVHYFTFDGQKMFELTQAVEEMIENYLHDNFDEDYEPTQEEMSTIIRALADYTRT